MVLIILKSEFLEPPYQQTKVMFVLIGGDEKKPANKC